MRTAGNDQRANAEDQSTALAKEENKNNDMRLRFTTSCAVAAEHTSNWNHRLTYINRIQIMLGVENKGSTKIKKR